VAEHGERVRLAIGRSVPQLEQHRSTAGTVDQLG
jgi:hypothetical protein